MHSSGLASDLTILWHIDERFRQISGCGDNTLHGYGDLRAPYACNSCLDLSADMCLRLLDNLLASGSRSFHLKRDLLDSDQGVLWVRVQVHLRRLRTIHGFKR